MKYTDVTVGQRVLRSRYRTNSPKWRAADCQIATVIAVGQPIRYEVATIGWDYRKEWREYNKGIHLLVTLNNTRPIVAGEGPLDPTYEADEIAAFLVPAEGIHLAAWEKAREADRKEERVRNEREQQEELLRERLLKQGITVEQISAGTVFLSKATVEGLLARLEELS